MRKFNIRKLNIRKFTALILAALLIAVSGPSAFADSGNTTSPGGAAAQAVSAGAVTSKEETVYASLNADGTVSDIYVVNILDVARKGTIQDFGNYTAVKNLTNLEGISNADGVTTAAADAGKFYYQGNIAGTGLPWDIAIRYILDGQATSAADLAGKSGRLVIELHTTMKATVDPSFYENYMLQISITLDAGKCSNLTAKSAVLANSGKNKIVTFTVMPNTDGDLRTEADVTGFEMEGISISALPFSMSIDLPDTSDMTSQMAQLSDAIAQLDDGITGLDAGIRELSGGARLLKKGSAEYRSGIAVLSAKSGDIIAASKNIGDSLNTISTMLSTGFDLSGLSSLSALPAALGSFSVGLGDISGGLSELKSGFSSAYAALDNAIAAIPGPIPEADLQVLYGANAGSVTFEKLMASYTAAQTVRATYSAVKPAFASVSATLNTVVQSLGTISASLESLSGQLSASLASLNIDDALTQLSTGISTLAANYGAFHAGLAAYSDGVAKLSANYADLHSGLSDLAGGLGDIYSGMSELSGGSSELREKTRDLPVDLKSAIDELISSYDHSDFVPISFVSTKNENVTSVQFVLMTDGIKLAEEPVIVPEATAKTVWDRLMELFG